MRNCLTHHSLYQLHFSYYLAQVYRSLPECWHFELLYDFSVYVCSRSAGPVETAEGETGGAGDGDREI